MNYLQTIEVDQLINDAVNQLFIRKIIVIEPDVKSKAVLQLSLDGFIVGEFETIRDVDKEGYNHSSVIKCCNGKQAHCAGYKWIYKKDMEKEKLNIEELMEDYTFDSTMFTRVSDRLYSILPVWNTLTRAEKTIMILYAELKSCRKVGACLGIRHTTIHNYIKRIRSKFYHN